MMCSHPHFRLIVLLVACCFFQLASSQPRTDATLVNMLQKNADSIFRMVLHNPDSFRLQIIYTRIERDKHNTPHFTNYYFNYQPEIYFNPASVVKLPLAALALEKLNRLKNHGINKYTSVMFDSSKQWQTALYHDSTSATGKISVAHLIKRALLISENDPYNRMYQFVGQQEINRSLHKKGFNEMQILRQFMGLSPWQNRYTNAVRFVDDNGTLLYDQPAAFNPDSIPTRKILLGRAHYNRNDSLVNAPFDFTGHNAMSLLSLQQLLQAIMFPSSVSRKQRFDLSPDDYRFLYQYLSQYPSETSYPKYDTGRFYDSYVKFFFRGSNRAMPKSVRVFNKVGWSYGFMTDVSYVADLANNIEFMLTTTIYVNSDGVINDGRYDYNTIGYPFFYQLGQTIYQHELARHRKYTPNLSAFRMPYEKRDPADKRPALTEVDN